MWNKKYSLIFIIFLFLAVRLFFLFMGFEKTFFQDEAYIGLIAKMIIEGREVPILDYQTAYYSGGSVVMGILTIPFFYIFGEYLISVKFLALTFSLGTLVLWYLFLKKYVSHSAAIFVSILFIFSPPLFIKSNLLVLGTQHYSSTFFAILALIFFFKIIYNKNTGLINYVLFGIISGFAMWFAYVYAGILLTCLLFWLIYDRTFFLRKGFWLFVVSFLAGSINIYSNITQPFQGIKNFQMYESTQPYSPFLNKLKNILLYDLAYFFNFSDYYNISGVTLNYLYYFVFIAFLILLVWLKRKLLFEIIILFPQRIKDKTKEKLPSIELFIFIYITIFIICSACVAFPIAHKSRNFFHYRFLIPLYPFIFAAIALSLDVLWNTQKKAFKMLTYASLIFYLGIHSIGLDAETSLKNFGKGIGYKGYSYSHLPWFFIMKDPDNESKIINRLNLFSNEEIFKNSTSRYVTFYFTLFPKVLLKQEELDLSRIESLISKIDERFHHNCYEGLGNSVAYKYSFNDIFLMLDKYKSMDERYKKYLYYGVAAGLPLQGNVGSHISMISQIEPQFQSYFYQGLGIRLTERMGLPGVDGILLQIDEANRKYCCIGIGQESAKRLEWAFPDKKYYIGFDGLNKEYRPDCYYGLGWGIGDFFEFDISRYLAIINNNVSQEYMEYCLKGLFDSLYWKFGGDAKKFQKATELFPEPYKTLNRKRLGLPVLLGSCDTQGEALGVYISGSMAYVANHNSGLQIISVSNPTVPKRLGRYDTPGLAFDVYVSGNTAYVADWESGLQIIDVSNPTAPALLGSYDTPGGTLDNYIAGSKKPPLPTQPPWAGGLDVYVSDNIAYVADGYGGIQIIDVSNPAAPALLGSYDTPGEALGVYVSGSKAYVADWNSGLQIIDVSNPAAPTLLGSYDTPDEAWDVHVIGGTAYVADGESGLQIIDVSNPSKPMLLGSYDTPSKAFGVYISGSTAYVANRDEGLKIIDVSDPALPVLLGSYDTPGSALDVYVSGGTAYVTDWNKGLQIIDVSSCLEIKNDSL